MGYRRFSTKWWLSLPFTFGETWKKLTPRDATTQMMCYWWHGSLQFLVAETLFKNGANATYRICNAGWRDPSWSLTIYELNCLLFAQSAIRAKKVLEIGTYDGNTALNLAANLPDDGEVVTIDLGVQEEPGLALKVEDRLQNVVDQQIVGRQFKDTPESSRILQVLGDSAKLNWSSLGGPFDLAFIDGCHAYDYVKSDTDNVLSVMRPGGVVLWHDYSALPSVARAVDEYRNRFEPFGVLQGTRLAVGFVKD
jgi:hypothetical protein